MTESQKWFWLTCALLLGVVLWLLSPILTPFLIALTLAYIGDPLVDRVEKHLPRGVAVACVFLLLTLLLGSVLLVLVPLLHEQLFSVSAKLPGYLARVQTHVLPWLDGVMGGQQLSAGWEKLQKALLDNWREASVVAARVIDIVSQSGMALVLWIANILLIPLLTFYLLRDWDRLVAHIHELIPRRVEPLVADMARDADEVLGAFLRGQFLVMLALSLIYSTGLWIVGVDFSLLIGLLAGLVSFVPYLGLIVGATAASVAGLLQFQDIAILLPIMGVFGVGQIVESFILTPLLVGDKIGLHPVAVIFAVMAGGQLFGFFGVLLALPIAAVLNVAMRYAHERYKQSQLYDRGGT